MDYIELTLDAADAEQAEILTAELADFPFESFEQEGARLKAYIPQERLADCKGEVDALLARYGVGRATFLSIEPQNWNALWESNFTPVEVDGRLTIRAPFHAPAATEAEVVIMPKMSFGTGHHATTCLMASGLLDRDVTGLRGLDMGSGTGVLAIVAALRGAETVDAVDIDEWAYENCVENIRANGVETRVTPLLGDIGAIAGRRPSGGGTAPGPGCPRQSPLPLSRFLPHIPDTSGSPRPGAHPPPPRDKDAPGPAGIQSSARHTR